ncbi:BRO1-domain-containing protein [Piedraia hortae CBS 480.64]|uniref:BRO1-domain-containing protein n=1 Tax=Piedraia hortae CBS 480.64 TaxID=1314780 RepID=A0A6A7C984_9PEZI|nr:BRO1-domain-containing protein [Piedraia hortae CBS 480.64]
MQTDDLVSIPFRRTNSVLVSPAIKAYILNKYDQHPSTFSADLRAIDVLRKEAVNATEPHTGGLHKLQEYAAQLVWMSGKIPVDLGVEFNWFPSLQPGGESAENNLQFELANILFNMAAMYSQLAVQSNRATSEGLKSAAANFCQAAGVIEHLKWQIASDLRSVPPDEMEPATLDSLYSLMLAQAQECFWQKAVGGKMKDLIVAKLAARVSDLYGESGESAYKSDRLPSPWVHHINAKHCHFAAAAQYRAACDALEKRKYGEEITRLRDSLACVNEGLQARKWLSRQVLADLMGLKSRVAEDLKRAEHDNDTIYFSHEPAKSELPGLDRANMVRAQIPREVSESQAMLGEKGQLGQPLFAKLVPYSVHQAASMYADRRDRLVNGCVIADLDGLTHKMQEVLSGLGLPGSLQALEKPLGIPPTVASHAQEVRQANGIHKINATISHTMKLKQDNQSVFNEGVDVLRKEATEDDTARRRFGTEQWQRPIGREAQPSLYEKVDELQSYFEQANETDVRVQKKLRQCESLVRLLGGSDRDLEDYVPSSRRANLTAKVERAAVKLRETMDEWNRFERRRRQKILTLKNKVSDDDIKPDLLRIASQLERENPMQPIAASHFESLFDERLRKYDPDLEGIRSEESTQKQILQKIQDANREFVSAKRGEAVSKEREAALQNLEDAYIAYHEVLRDLDAGQTFYTQLAPLVAEFKDQCKEFAETRKVEAKKLEDGIVPVTAKTTQGGCQAGCRAGCQDRETSNGGEASHDLVERYANHLCKRSS